MRNKQVVVIGSGDDDQHLDTAFEIGKYIAENKWVLITGGGGGIMEAASKGASVTGGIVVGILPDSDLSRSNEYCSIVIPSGIGYARNMTNILSGDVIVSINGKSGTLSELAYAWQFGKPVISCAFTGGWSSRIVPEPVDDRPGSKIFKADSLTEVFQYLYEILI